MEPIHLSGHAKDQLIYRGAKEEEVIESIQSSEWKPAGSGRNECRKNFTFENEWNYKFYKIKQIRPIFV